MVAGGGGFVCQVYSFYSACLLIHYIGRGRRRLDDYDLIIDYHLRFRAGLGRDDIIRIHHTTHPPPILFLIVPPGSPEGQAGRQVRGQAGKLQVSR